ncbi:MAG: L-2-amino-thiazoline-4-carboxylic acid hydrolase [Candidatus Marinimicrobia bacterium]|nr:L-2-amino-thiazoline-4-carboxylic acid hydrolase [Candidatus Neomarinimicrobiota bacterium]
METEKKIQLVQNTYAAVLADATVCFTKFGILEEITRIKKETGEHVAKFQIKAFGIESEIDVFLKLAEIFNCANWEIKKQDDGFSAQAKTCKLCTLTKKSGGDSPCNLYCLNPMRALVKEINSKAQFNVITTLWDGDSCRVTVNWR